MPSDFRFAVKLPRAITHERRLVDCGDLIATFAEQTAHLDSKRGPVLVQLPPSLIFDAKIVGQFLAHIRGSVGDGPIVCEPRHASWFTAAADQLLAEHRVVRAAADPARVPEAAVPGGWPGLAYTRLHGSPRIYWSRYGDAAIARLAAEAAASDVESWTIFDNTASGAAIENALAMRDFLLRMSSPRR